MDIFDCEFQCYQYFKDRNIKNRSELRKEYKTCPINGVSQSFAENLFQQFKNNFLNKEKNHAKNSQTVCISDLHIPYQDNKTLDLVFDCIVNLQPENLVLLGDILDCYWNSSFVKNPKNQIYLQDEADIFYRKFSYLRKYIPHTNIYYIMGNHEDRILKNQWEKPQFIGLRALEPRELLKLDKLNMDIYKNKIIINDFIYYHGDKVSSKSSYTAKAEFEGFQMNSGISGHCFSEDTEILTNKGWKKVIDTEIGEIVGTINKETKAFEWNEVKDKFVYDNYKELYHIKSSVIDLMVTDKHGLVGYNKRNGKFEEFTASELATTSKRYKFICAAELNNEKGIDISESMIRLLVNISADGCIEDNSIRFHLKKKRKIDHLKSLLNQLNLDYSEKLQITGNTKIRILTKDAKPIIDKFFMNGKKLPIILKNVNKEQAFIVLDEYSITDGNKHADSVNSYQISSSKLEEMNLLQEIFSKNGFRSSLIKRPLGNYNLTVNLRSLTYISRDNVSIVPYKGRVSCLSVDNGTLLVRRNGKTVITQNTHRLGSYYHTYDKCTKNWFENGCLCDLDPEYIREKVNWQQGFSVVNYFEGINQVDQILIQDHKFKYEGKVYC